MFKKNTKNSYAPLSKFFHMLWGLCVLTCYSTFYYKDLILPEKHPSGRFLIAGIHKPVGTLLLLIMMFAFAWHLRNRKPNFSPSMRPWEKSLALFTQRALYFFLMFMPLSGFLMSTASGYPINMFGLFKTPLFLAKNKELGKTLFTIHGYLAWFGLGLIVLHLLGVLKQEALRKDPVTRKMFPKFLFRKK